VLERGQFHTIDLHLLLQARLVVIRIILHSVGQGRGATGNDEVVHVIDDVTEVIVGVHTIVIKTIVYSIICINC